MTKRGIEIGTAGEHIVCADLLLAGHRATLSGAGMPYDVVADIDGRCLRVAVKSCLQPKPRPGREGSKHRYYFNFQRQQMRWDGKRSRHNYTAEDADIVALVGLDRRQVGYLWIGHAKSSIWIEADSPQPESKFAHPRDGVVRTFEAMTFQSALGAFHGK